MPWIKRIRLCWLCSSITAVAIAQCVFTGLPTSEVAGNLVFYMLITSLPSSVLACVLMFPLLNVLDDFNLFPYASRMALFSLWLVYFLLGLCQWYVISLFSHAKSKKPA